MQTNVPLLSVKQDSKQSWDKTNLQIKVAEAQIVDCNHIGRTVAFRESGFTVKYLTPRNTLLSEQRQPKIETSLWQSEVHEPQ